MKKGLYIFFLIIAFYGCKSYNYQYYNKKKDLVGIYLNESGMDIIKIKKDSFLYIRPQQNHFPVYYSDTLALCHFKRVGNELIELNTLSPDERVKLSMQVQQEKDIALGLGKHLAFNIPIQQNLKISILTDNFKRYNLAYSESQNNIVLPQNTKEISILIEPTELKSHADGGFFFSAVHCSLPIIKIENDANLIKVLLPAMDDMFFERFYIKGEYARICGDTIIWKGESFIKQSK